MATDDRAPGNLPRENVLTRERLAQGVLLQSLRANAPPGVRVRSDDELDASLDEALRDHAAAEDLYVFGYGSLMWNPAIDVASASVAHVHGWHRRFSLRTVFGRGTVQEPGAMLALDRGGSCRGLLFRIEAAKVRNEARLLWQREMLTGAYEARWVTARSNGATLRALTFVANRTHERYAGAQPIEDIARWIATGQGSLGTSRAYFDAMRATLDALGVRDKAMKRLQRVLDRTP